MASDNQLRAAIRLADPSAELDQLPVKRPRRQSLQCTSPSAVEVTRQEGQRRPDGRMTTDSSCTKPSASESENTAQPQPRGQGHRLLHARVADLFRGSFSLSSPESARLSLPESPAPVGGSFRLSPGPTPPTLGVSRSLRTLIGGPSRAWHARFSLTNQGHTHISRARYSTLVRKHGCARSQCSCLDVLSLQQPGAAGSNSWHMAPAAAD